MISTHRIALFFLMASGVAIGASAPACSLALNTPSSQCHSQDDCLARGPDFANTTCSPNRTCVPISVVKVACTSNKECIGMNGGGKYTCTSEGKCISLINAQCTKLYADNEDLANDNTIFIGNIVPPNLDGSLEELAIELARREIKRGTGGMGTGLPPAKQGGPQRPLAIVSCDAEQIPNGTVTQADFNRAINFVETQLKVPVQLGPFTTQEAVNGALSAIRNDVMMFTTNPTDELSTLPRNDLIFRVGFANSVTVKIIPPFVTAYLTARATTDLVLTGADTIRVALVFEKVMTPVKQEIAQLLTAAGISFQTFDIGSTADALTDPNPNPQINLAIQGVYAYQPHIIVWGLGPIHVGDVYVPLAKTWPAALPVPYSIAPLPWSSLIPNGLANLKDIWRQRFFGLNTVSTGYSQADFDSFTGNLKLEFPEAQNQTPSLITSSFYDSVYMAAYAIVAAGDVPLTGVNISKGLRHVADVSGGAPVKWGSSGLAAGFATLLKGQNISYVGASGPYNFTATGDPQSGNPFVYCMGLANGVPNLAQASGYYLDTSVTPPQPQGTVTCP